MGTFNKGASTNVLHIIADILFGCVAVLVASIIYYLKKGFMISNSYIVTCIMILLVFILSNKESRMYNVTTFFYVDRIIRFITKSFLITTGVTTSLLFYVGRANINIFFYTTFLIIFYFSMIFSTFLARFLVRKMGISGPRTLLIGVIEDYQTFERYLGKSNFLMKIMGYVSIHSIDVDERYLSNVENLEKVIHYMGIDQVYIMNRNYENFDIQRYINLCMDIGVTVRIILDTYQNDSAQSYVSCVGTYPVLTYHRVSLNNSSKFLKRMIDVIGSISGIILSSPFMVIAAVAIRIDSKGPILFKQIRVGQNGRKFEMYKFRSMCIDAERKKKELMGRNEMEGKFMFKMHDDPRITKVGKFIRKTSIDELPQFFNVLKGDMSLVGTRPPTLDEVKHYERNHWRRMSIKPGITGMWQVSGRSTITDFKDIVELDTEYIDQWSVITDFRIMLKTIIRLILPKDAC